MLLRGSGQHAGESYDDRAAIDSAADSGVDDGRVLLAFADAAVGDAADLGEKRDAVRQALGDAATVDAAAVIAIFQAVVKIADATGIPLEDAKAEVSAEFRAELGLDDFAAG